MIQRLLIANRGEIACRILRSCRAQGIESVAVHSEVDRLLPHVQEADYRVCLGPAPARESYLNVEALLQAARETGADAVHPGYGFLSENAHCARACAEAGLTFVGPPAKCIELMGDKAAARRTMADSGVPVLPGFDSEDASDEELVAHADSVGWPLLIKAVAGGGGKGMRVVRHAGEFREALEAARREAGGAFGDARMMLERFLPRVRHVEVQVFADDHGNCVHLFERDCSVQRRHQKIIEEAPAPGIDSQLREALGAAAVRAARAIDYRGAGTVEFLLTPDGSFYFMEMNTRLQVEHPVTEAITGEDLVAWQLRVAAGEPLPRPQEALSIQGHAMEVRVYAEDPARDFMPSSGTLAVLEWPRVSGLRVDSGFREGDTVTEHYDPLLAKVITHGEDRDQARRKLAAALHDTRIAGPRHNTGFLAALLEAPAFVRAELSTSFLEDHPEAGSARAPDETELFIAAALLWRQQVRNQDHPDPWRRSSGWRALGRRRFHARLALGGEPRDLAIEGDHDPCRILLDGQEYQVRFSPAATDSPAGNMTAAMVVIDGRSQRFSARLDGDHLWLFHRGHSHDFRLRPPALAAEREDAQAPFAAPMSGTVVACHVKAEQRVEAGEAVITMEAMKMEHTLRAPQAGVITALPWSTGDTVSEGTLLAEFCADDEGESA